MRLKQKKFAMSDKASFEGSPGRTDIYLMYDPRYKSEFSYGALCNTILAGCSVGASHIKGSDLYKGQSVYGLPSGISFLAYAYAGNYKIGM